MDVTAEARAIMSCVQAMRGRFGKTLVVDVLRGADNGRIRELGLQKLPCFGRLGAGWNGPGTQAAPAVLLREVVELLAVGEHLVITEGTYPTVGFGPRFREVADPGFRLTIKQSQPRQAPARKRADADGRERLVPGESCGRTFGGRSMDAADEGLFEELRALRKRLADAMGKPPYVVFSDATLHAMAAMRPATDEEFLEISGVGLAKLKCYGEDFMAAIRYYEKKETD